MKWFKSDPNKKTQKQYEKLLRAAMERQRQGDIQGSAQLHAEAEQLQQSLQENAS